LDGDAAEHQFHKENAHDDYLGDIEGEVSGLVEQYVIEVTSKQRKDGD